MDTWVIIHIITLIEDVADSMPVKERPYNITSLYLDHGGILRMGTAGEGVLEINTRTLHYATDSNLSYLHPRVRIFKDSDGIVSGVLVC